MNAAAIKDLHNKWLLTILSKLHNDSEVIFSVI